MIAFVRLRHVVGAILAAVACASVGLAQQPSAPAPQPPAGGQPSAPASPGQPPAPSARAGFSALVEGKDLLVQRRRFQAGNRTYWHTHEKGFLILVEEGRARVQKRGEAMKELGPGDTDYTPPGVWHWHGAAPKEDFVQIGVSFGGGITFTDPVTDAEYQTK